LKDADFVIEPLDESERHLVCGLAVSADSVPVALDELGELLEGLRPLPAQRRAPVREEAAGPDGVSVCEQLPEGLFQKVRGIQPLVDREELSKSESSLEGEIFVTGQERVLLAFDEAPFLARDPRVLALSDLVEGFAQMTQDMELVEQNGRLRSMALGGVAERFPHVHNRDLDTAGFPLSEPLVEGSHALLGTVDASKPDGPSTHQVADHDPVAVLFSDRDLVDPDHARSVAAAPAKLLSHVLLLELLDRVPVEPQLLGHVLDRRRSTSSAYVHREALGVQGIVREKGELLALHSSATPARNPADPDSQKDPRVRARQVPHLSLGAVVEDPSRPPARRARRFFERRTSEMTRA